MNPEPVLPRKPSALIRVAVSDARQLDPARYTPDAKTWHTARPWGEGCAVCDAGAVIAVTFGVKPSATVRPESIERAGTIAHDDTLALTALDEIRAGNYNLACKDLGLIVKARELEAVPLPTHGNYDTWPEFRDHLEEMEVIADAFEALDL